MKSEKSLISAVMVCSMTLTAVASPIAAAADDFDSQIQQQDQKIADLKNQQADAQSQIDALESQVSEINTQAQDLLAKQDTLRQESAQLVKDIADLQERIENVKIQSKTSTRSTSKQHKLKLHRCCIEC